MTSELKCRTCGASPADMGDAVSPHATAYTCSMCLGPAGARQTSGRVQRPSPCVSGPYPPPEGIECTRCGETRWPTGWQDPFVCRRCQVAVAGGNAVDPLPPAPTEAQRRAWEAAALRLEARRSSPTTDTAPSVEIAAPAQGESTQAKEHRPCRRHRPVWRLVCSDCNPEAQHAAGALPENWRSVRAGVLKRDGRRCKHCGSRSRLGVHHITPRPLGTHDPRNLVTLCDDCHDTVEQPAEIGTV